MLLCKLKKYHRDFEISNDCFLSTRDICINYNNIANLSYFYDQTMAEPKFADEIEMQEMLCNRDITYINLFLISGYYCL